MYSWDLFSEDSRLKYSADQFAIRWEPKPAPPKPSAPVSRWQSHSSLLRAKGENRAFSIVWSPNFHWRARGGADAATDQCCTQASINIFCNLILLTSLVVCFPPTLHKALCHWPLLDVSDACAHHCRLWCCPPRSTVIPLLSPESHIGIRQIDPKRTTHAKQFYRGCNAKIQKGMKHSLLQRRVHHLFLRQGNISWVFFFKATVTFNATLKTLNLLNL